MTTESLVYSAEPPAAGGQAASRGWSERIGYFLLFAILYYAAVGSSPFSRTDIVDSSGGNAINQIVWLGFAAITMGAALYNMPMAQRLLIRSWPLFAVLLWVLATSRWAPYPDLTIRRGGLLTITAIAGFGVAMTAPKPEVFLRVLVVFTGLIMTVNVLTLVLLPGLATAGEGAAIGMHSHKNTAGQMALFAFLTWLVAAVTIRDIRLRAILAGGTVVWFAFLYLTQSKTSLAVGVAAPFAVLLAVLLMKTQGLIRLLVIALVIGGAALIWSAILGAGLTMDDIVVAIVRDTTFTGRTGLWEFIWIEITNHPYLGYGYGSFWNTGLRLSPTDFANGFIARTGQSHNGYLDIILHTGFIGLGLSIIVIIRSAYLAASLAFRRGLPIEEMAAYRLALIFVGAIIVVNLMESSYLRANHFLSVLFMILYFVVERWSVEIRARVQSAEA